MFYSDILRETRQQQMDIREAASLRQQRRMKQAVQFIHKDSMDLLPLDGLKKLGTSKETQPHNILQRRLLESNLSKLRANNRGTWPSNNSFPMQSNSFHQIKQEFHRTHDDDLIFVCCKCAGLEMKLQIDTGSQNNLISSACVDKLGLKEYMKTDRNEMEKMGMPFLSKVIGQMDNIAISVGQLNIKCSAVVVDDDKKILSLGLQTLRSLKCIIDMEKQYLILGEKEKEEIPFLNAESCLNEDGGLHKTGCLCLSKDEAPAEWMSHETLVDVRSHDSCSYSIVFEDVQSSKEEVMCLYNSNIWTLLM